MSSSPADTRSSSDYSSPDTNCPVRNPQAEAQELLSSKQIARVLEPSPPAVQEPPYLADDPVAVSDVDSPAAIVAAGMPGDNDWGKWLADHPEHHRWVQDHWLGGNRRLPAAPSSLTTTRESLHRLAAYVIGPARHFSNGKFGLRWTLGGFGTPFFGEGRQIRVRGSDLVDQSGDVARSRPITTLQEAADFLNSPIDSEAAAEGDSTPLGDVNQSLEIDAVAATFLGDWFGMSFAALELLRSDPESVKPSRPQLWPGHFDAAIEVGDEDHRGSYGASPGDAAINEPYLYMSIWWPDRLGVSSEDPFWNAPSFVGRILKLSDFAPDTDPAVEAATFWRESRDRISAATST